MPHPDSTPELPMEAHSTKTGSSGLLRRSAALAAVLFAAVTLFPQGAPATDQEPEKMEDTRAVLQQWVETRKLISAEKADWELGKQLMNDRIGLLEREIDGLKTRIEEMDVSIAESQGTEQTLNAQNDELKAASVTLRERVTALEARVKELLKRMPQQILDQTAPLAQSIPEDPNDTELSLSVRYRNIVGILNLINKFNTEIHIKSEMRELANGRTADVLVLYFGIGQAYYVTDDQSAAGIGTVGEEGWTWIPANEHAAAIAQAIAVYNNEEPAAFVKLPVEIQ